jgi:hypothetical protein
MIHNIYNQHVNNKWLLFGDFNMILSSHEKYGGNPMDNKLTTLFRNTLNHCDLQDLGYTGDIFTWNNKQSETQLIKERLDRFLANSEWANQFPSYQNSHLLRFKSDHSPILLEFNHCLPLCQNKPRSRIMRFEQVWIRDDQHFQVVKDAWVNNSGPTYEKLEKTLHSLNRWGSSRFGIIPRKIQAKQQELLSLNKQNGPRNLHANIQKTEAELDDLLESEELWWSQRSRAMWLQHGDKNTKFFHLKVISAKK